MSIPGKVAQGIEDSLLGCESEPTASDKMKSAMGEGLGAAAAEKARQYREIHRRLFKDKKVEHTSEQSSPEFEL